MTFQENINKQYDNEFMGRVANKNLLQVYL